MSPRLVNKSPEPKLTQNAREALIALRRTGSWPIHRGTLSAKAQRLVEAMKQRLIALGYVTLHLRDSENEYHVLTDAGARRADRILALRRPHGRGSR